MSCSSDKAKKLPSCLNQLIIGTVANGALDYFVYLKTPDGRIDKYEAVDIVYTNLIGINDIEVRTGTQYELWITTTTAANMNERTAFTVDGQTETSTSVLIEFLPCYESDVQEEFTSQTITLE